MSLNQANLAAVSASRDLEEALTEKNPFAREGAARELGRLLLTDDEAVALAARLALERLIRDDDSRRVTATAESILAEFGVSEKNVSESGNPAGNVELSLNGQPSRYGEIESHREPRRLPSQPDTFDKIVEVTEIELAIAASHDDSSALNARLPTPWDYATKNEKVVKRVLLDALQPADDISRMHDVLFRGPRGLPTHPGVVVLTDRAFIAVVELGMKKAKTLQVVRVAWRDLVSADVIPKRILVDIQIVYRDSTGTKPAPIITEANSETYKQFAIQFVAEMRKLAKTLPR